MTVLQYTYPVRSRQTQHPLNPERRSATLKFLVIIEEGEHNFSAYSPDLPGCITTGDTLEETTTNMQEAIAFHLEGLAANKMPLPQTTPKQVEFIEVPRPDLYQTGPLA